MGAAVDEKEIRWVGSSYPDLLAFPSDPRKEAGFQLGKVQAGLEPTDWKPFEEVGIGAKAGDVETWQAAYALQPTKRFFFRLKVQIP